MARVVLASRPALKRRFGSFSAAPLKKFSFTWSLNAPAAQIIPLLVQTAVFHFHSSVAFGAASRINLRSRTSSLPRQSPSSAIMLVMRCDAFKSAAVLFVMSFPSMATSFLLMPVFAVVVRRPRTDGGSDDSRIDLGGHRTLHVSRDEQEGANERSYRSAENASIRIVAANFLRRAGLPLRRQNRRPDSNALPKRLSRDAPNGSGSSRCAAQDRTTNSECPNSGM